MTSLIQASSVLLVRAEDSTVFLVHRSPMLRFMGGFVALPGGKLDEGDADPAACALRELFEETGVWLGGPPGDHAALRRAVLAGTSPFPGASSAHLQPVGRLVTPPFSPARFDTSFYLAFLPEGQSAEVWPGELDSGAWWTVADALAAWERGELLLSPPTYNLLESLAGHPVEQWSARLRETLDDIDSRRMPPIWFSPGVRLVPLYCAGLPPTQYTNSFVVGTATRVLIDPGPSDPVEQEILLAEAAGVQAIIVTHHHPDHIGAVQRLVDEWDIPVWTSVDAAARLGSLRVDRIIDDGTILDLGGLELHALITPGHAPGHLAFWEPHLRLLFAGDLVSPLSSVIVDPDDGDITDYMASLRRVRALPMRILLPSHGPPTTRGRQLIDKALAHRVKREMQLLDALSSGMTDVAELARELYRGSPDATMRLAERQIESMLIYLRREGRWPEA